jgi:hypothetical protein
LSEFLTGVPHHEIFKRVNAREHIATPKLGNHRSYVFVAHRFGIFYRQIPNFVSKFIENLDGMGGVGNIWVSRIIGLWTNSKIVRELASRIFSE